MKDSLRLARSRTQPYDKGLISCLLVIHFITGLTAFDFISDFEEWIECGYFNEEFRARLKGNL